MRVVPCARCGYDSPAPVCPHCAGGAHGTGPGTARGLWGELSVGLAALPRGLLALCATPGTKRWLLPPFLITTGAFAVLFAWLWRLYGHWTAWLAEQAESELALDTVWLREALEWLMRLRAFLWLFDLASAAAFLALGALAAFWVFSIVYEAVSGPFLDEIHARIEQRWFGADPRNRLYRPVSIPAGDCAALSAVAGAAGLGLALAWIALGAPRALFAVPLCALLPFVVLGLARREFGRWLVWVARLEGGTLWVSLKAATFAGLILLLCLPLKFVPGVGFLLFGLAAGFTTAVSLLDIPCERRRWSLRQRLSFLGRHLPAIVAFGSVASLLFVVPVIGPVLMVPAASAGGLWLLVALDKHSLRRGGAGE